MSVSYLDEYIAGRCMRLSVMSQGNLIICASQTFTKLATRSSDDEKGSVVEESMSYTDEPLTDLARGRNKIYVQNGILECVSHLYPTTSASGGTTGMVTFWIFQVLPLSRVTGFVFVALFDW
jgi:hypothetical protein